MEEYGRIQIEIPRNSWTGCVFYLFIFRSFPRTGSKIERKIDENWLIDFPSSKLVSNSGRHHRCFAGFMQEISPIGPKSWGYPQSSIDRWIFHKPSNYWSTPMTLETYWIPTKYFKLMNSCYPALIKVRLEWYPESKSWWRLGIRHWNRSMNPI